MSDIFYTIKKNFCLIIVGLLMFSLSAMADENVISSVVISKAKDKQNAYELNIDSTMPVDFKENKEDGSMIYFDLKNSVLAEDVGTVYDDAANIDNVVVKQIDKNKVRIYVKGADVKNTELVFVNSLFETKEQPKKIVLNRPINEYKPTDNSISEADVLESQDEIQDWDDNSFNFSHLMTELFSGTKKEILGIIGALFVAFLLVILAVKSVATKISQDTEPLIGLNHAKEHDKANDIYSKAYQKQTPKQIKTEDIDFETIANKNRALKEAQEQLSKAHSKYQAYLQSRYKNNVSKNNNDSLERGLAVNQYKKSMQNPYLDQEVIRINPTNNNVMSEGSFKIPPRPKTTNTVNKRVSNPYIQRTERTVKNHNLNSNNQTSMKFLESVTKIYEQSGREDLAMGLKNSIAKTKQKI